MSAPHSSSTTPSAVAAAGEGDTTTNHNHNDNNDKDNVIRSQKQALRRRIRQQLKALSVDDIYAQSAAVWHRVHALPAYRAARSVGLFVSMPTGEIQTALALQHALDECKVLYVPRVGPHCEYADMELVRVDPVGAHHDSFTDAWPRNTWGIPEPPADAVVTAQPGDLDLLIVPGVALDRFGQRLGHGKGYYDRFVARMSTSTQRPTLVAVALACQLVPEPVPTSAWDCTMDVVVVPSETIVVTSPSLDAADDDD